MSAPHFAKLRQKAGWILGPSALLITLLLPPPDGLSPEGWATIGVGTLMAVWWVCETIPIPATALLPLALFPALGICDVSAAAAPFANPLIFLFLGGFLIAAAMQRWNLHRRIALNIIAKVGTRPHRILLGFLCASAFLSMWVSNTATTMMMYPIALSVVHVAGQTKDRSNFGVALMLGVAYGATTGGMATLIGTPPNALLAGFLDTAYGVRLGFGQWMMMGVPLTLCALPIIYLVLTRLAFRLDRSEIPGLADLINEQRIGLGRISRQELLVAIVFTITALAWICQPLLESAFPLLSDTVIAIGAALLLFMLPAGGTEGGSLLDWESTKDVPWGVLLLFGGGLSLAANVQGHGVSTFIGAGFEGMNGWPILLLMALICFTMLMLTELTSNTATAAAFLPVVAAIAISLGQNPLLLLIPTALAANCAFMLPVGTPPNAIVFGSGLITLPQMARTGLVLNIVLVPLVLAAVILIGATVFGIEFDTLPDWLLAQSIEPIQP